jgi:hypothetical protein
MWHKNLRKERNMNKMIKVKIVLMLAMSVFIANFTIAQIVVKSIKPTPFFPRTENSSELFQLAKLELLNSGNNVEGNISIYINGQKKYSKPLGIVAKGNSLHEILVPDISSTEKIEFRITNVKDNLELASKKIDWIPQKKWVIHSISYSHHDLGYGNFPHRLRQDNRNLNMEVALEYCRETDHWADDDKYRAMIETSEPVTAYIGSYGKEKGKELAKRIEEGRIQLGGLHTTVNTELLGHETMARLFYMTNRHSRDLLGIPKTKAAMFNDVLSLTWPYVTYSTAANVNYIFHGYNHPTVASMMPASDDIVFYLQGPDKSPENIVLFYSTPYSSDRISGGKEPLGEDLITDLIRKYERKNWPFSLMISQAGGDFAILDKRTAIQIRALNAKYEYPHFVCSTLDKFFTELIKEVTPENTKTYYGDGNNQWSDQEASDAVSFGRERKLGELIASTEKIASLAALNGNSYPWKDIYQAYHSLLLHHEHSVNASCDHPATQHILEAHELREIALTSEEYTHKALNSSLRALSSNVSTSTDQSLMIFNPLNFKRTDIVFLDMEKLGDNFRLIDTETKKKVQIQRFTNGRLFFVADNVPSLGYKTYEIKPGGTIKELVSQNNKFSVENKYYSILFDKKSGAIISIFDKEIQKELVDKNSPHQFNEYLYQRYEEPNGSKGKWYRASLDEIKVSKGDIADIIQVKVSGVGAKNIWHTITLHHKIKRIDFKMDLVKSFSGRSIMNYNDYDSIGREALFVTMPFDIKDFKIQHELPGSVAEPFVEQFDSSNTAYYAIRHFSDISNKDYGITVSPIDNGLVAYGEAHTDPVPGVWGFQYDFKKDRTYPKNSWMYLYLLNNMFETNVLIDQSGPISFSWSIMSHLYDWKKGDADLFGWGVHNPLMPGYINGKQDGELPSKHSFISTDKQNVICTTIKNAEQNGRGVIVRFVETKGINTNVNVQTNLSDKQMQCIETDLVENNISNEPTVKANGFSFYIKPFGVKTFRLYWPESELKVDSLKAQAISDMKVALDWKLAEGRKEQVSHYNVYAGMEPDFEPNLLNLIQRVPNTNTIDGHEYNYGGWINRVLNPVTFYYYKVSAVDKWNNEGPVSSVAEANTLQSEIKNDSPKPVIGLNALLISHISDDNFVQLIWRSNIDPDILKYEIYRSTKKDFIPSSDNMLNEVYNGEIDHNEIYSQPWHYRMPLSSRSAYDHQMYTDQTVKPGIKYYYKVRAVDGLKISGEFSHEASVATKEE